MADGTGAAPAPSSGGGLADNVAGLLVYLIGILAIVFLLIEPYNKNKFVRFHCFQAIFYFLGSFVIGIGMGVLTVVGAMIDFVGIFSMLGMLLWLAYFVGWIACMIKAFQGQMWKLPVIGNLAEKYA